MSQHKKYEQNMSHLWWSTRETGHIQAWLKDNDKKKTNYEMWPLCEELPGWNANQASPGIWAEKKCHQYFSNLNNDLFRLKRALRRFKLVESSYQTFCHC